MKRMWPIALCACAACLSGGEALEGIAATNASDQGPTIVFDLLAEPLPEIPFPNDVGTRPDLGSPTGRRINVSSKVPTRFESRVRELIDGLDGFGTYSPIVLSFDAPIDAQDLHARQNDFNQGNDAIYVVSLDPKSASYGKPVPLDFGSGRFPLAVQRTDMYLMNDPRRESSNLLFETYEEDLNQNGVLDEGEDTDFDGVLDHPNTWGTLLGDASRNDPYDDLIGFYELESNTLSFRPVMPLDEQTKYAVIITRRLHGLATGSPVRSPFPSVNHTQQTPALMPLVKDGLLADLGLDVGDVAFAWSFTTQSVRADLEALRAGLYGHGTFAWMGSSFPARVAQVIKLDGDERANGGNLLEAERLIELFEDPTFADAAGMDGGVAEYVIPLVREFVDYVVEFRLESPALIENEDGAMRIDRLTGAAEYERGDIYAICVVPRAREGSTPPFPVTFFEHGHGSSKFDALLWGLIGARFGTAVCGIDAYGHGLLDNDFVRAVVSSGFAPLGLQRLADGLFMGRARDLNGDGMTDSGGDYWTYRAFHTRDVVRQTALDHYQTVRVMRAFGKSTMPVDVNGDGREELAGDFNGDGVVDFGADAPFAMTGGSLGGIVTMVTGASEPAFKAAAPVVGGAGLFDIAMRTSLGGPVNAVWGFLMGPTVTARVSAVAGRLDLVQDLIDVSENATQNGVQGIRFATVPDPTLGHNEELTVGDRVRLENLDTGAMDEAMVRSLEPGKMFRVAVRTDKGNRLRLSLFRPGSSSAYRVVSSFEREVNYQAQTHEEGEDLEALQEGWALKRGTPDLRRFVGIAQAVLDPGDPANYATAYANPYEIRPEGKVKKPFLVMSTVGDPGVPVSTGIACARIAGAIDFTTVDPNYGVTQDQYLIDSKVIEGVSRLSRFTHDPCHYDPRPVLFDVDETSHNVDPMRGPSPSRIVTPPECDGSSVQPGYCSTSCVSRPPMRATVEKNGVTLASRVIYVRPEGKHGFSVFEEGAAFDYSQYASNQLMRFLTTQGRELSDDPCLEDSSCDFIPQPSVP